MAQNLRVRCRAHNQLWAEQAFGRERIEESRHLRRQESTRRCDESALRPLPTPEHDEASETQQAAIFGKVRLALRSMGFRSDEVRRAIAVVVRMHPTSEPLAIEQALREALVAATAA
jgi:hypothetical protein